MKVAELRDSIEYEKLRNTNIAIIRRQAGKTETDECPFCGKNHEHGTADGHRVAHCSSGENTKKQIVAPDGTVLMQSMGYIIKSH